MLKKPFLFLLKIATCCFILIALSSCSNTSAQFVTAKDQQLDLSQQQGKWLVVNYWATWCHSCINEIKVFDDLQKRIKNKNIELVSVNYDFPSKRQLKKLVKRFHIKYPVLLRDPAKQLNLGHVYILPTTFIINPEGRVVAKLESLQTVNTILRHIR